MSQRGTVLADLWLTQVGNCGSGLRQKIILLMKTSTRPKVTVTLGLNRCTESPALAVARRGTQGLGHIYAAQ